MQTKQQTRRRVAVTWDQKFEHLSKDITNLERALKNARRERWDLAQEARDVGYPVSVLAKMMKLSTQWVDMNTAPKGSRRAKERRRYGS